MALSFVLTLCMLFACVNVGTIDADASDNYNSGTWKVLYVTGNEEIAYGVWDVDFTFTIDQSKLDGNDLKLYVIDWTPNPQAYYGNQTQVNCNNTDVTLPSDAQEGSKYIKLMNAKNYSSVTLHIHDWNNGTVKVKWVGGTLNSVTASAGYTTGCDSTMGTVGVSNSPVTPGTNVTFTATAESGYQFMGWYNAASNGTCVSTENPYIAPINSNKTLYAKFIDTATANTYYTVNFSSGANGTVTAASNGKNITSGTQVKYGTQVTFTANPSSGYNFARWTGTNTGTTSPMTVMVQGAVNVKGSFTKVNAAESNGNIYFRWGTSSNITDGNNLNNALIKAKNGRAYGYIDNPGTSNTYFFTVSNGADDWNSGMWIYNKSNFQTVTDFNGYVTVGKSDLYNNSNNQNGYELGTAKVNNDNVSRLIIDLGKYDESTNAFSLDNDTFRVIPVFNTDSEKLSIYAKDGSYRGDTTYDFWNSIGETTLSGATNVVDHANFDTGVASRGQTITVTTVVNNTKYYVKGFSVNGVTPELYDERTDNTYTLNYTIPADFEDDYLEITPIYYFKDDESTPTVNFVIENYDEDLQNTGWGNTLSVYPYYFVSGKDDLNNRDNAFGGYPGQPVINYGGRRFIQIPTSYIMDRADRKDTYNNVYAIVGDKAIIKGITLSNDYWDVVHRDYVQEVDTHLQTYDYDDFYKIYKETSEGKEVNYVGDGSAYAGRNKVPDQITFAFKYRIDRDNFETVRFTDNGYGNKPGTTPTTISNSIDINDYETNGNGWDKYLDYYDREINLFGRILTDEEKTNAPLYVVSSGYERTHAGYYATTWSVYNNDGSYIGTVTPSILEISSADRINTTNYPDSTGRGSEYPDLSQLSAFKDAYNTLKGENYVHRPVMITYEKALGNGEDSDYYHAKASEYSVRSDGRWYYSYYSDNITANIRIDYKDDPSAEKWTEDEFKNGTNIGPHTGATAKFTNEDFDGKTTMTALADINKNFTFTATKPSGYIFQGWWFERDGIATRVTENDVLSGQSAMTSNATFVARYVKSPSGTLTINHTVDDTNSTGDGKTYIAVKAIPSTGTAKWLTGTTPTDVSEEENNDENAFEQHLTENQFEIPSEYISYGSGYTFNITLYTVPDDFSSLNDISASNNNTSNFLGLDLQLAENRKTFSITVDNLFEMKDGFPVQKYDVLPYVSLLSVQTYNYVFTYEYDAFVKAYGQLGYTVRGVFNHDQLSEYMKIETIEPKEQGDAPVECETKLSFKDDSAKTTFLNLVAPYEDNFMKTISWKTSEVNPSYDADTTTLSAEIAADYSNTTINLNFKLPYAHENEAEKFTPKYSDGTTVQKNGENGTTGNLDLEDGKTISYVEEPGIEAVTTYAPLYGQVFSFNDVHYNFDKDHNALSPELLEAPPVLDNNGTPYYFRYWSVTSRTEDHVDVEYTRCYNNVFDYVLFQNSTVEPIYTPLAKDAQTGETESIPTPRSEYNKDEKGITITFIENSRNQFNESQFQNKGAASINTEAGDRVYSNFLISMNNAAKLGGDTEVQLNTLNDTEAANIKAGLVIEWVGGLNTDAAGNYIVNTEAEYETHYNTSKPVNIDTVKNYITNGGSGFLKAEFNVSELNDKNRINYYYGMPNKISPELTQTTFYRNQVYRAYAYLKNGDTVSVSADPVYFTIYEIGSIDLYEAP